MQKKELLLRRLQEIGLSIEQSKHGLALIGLGSVGLETHRLDDYSDLDFFVIVEAGFKQQYIENLNWLSSIAPLTYQFRNTVDGYKTLFADGVFCEFAVFEKAELSHIPFAPGRIIWKRADVDEAIATPIHISHPYKHSIDWLLGEAITNLYVGLSRYRRGEKLSAARFVQQFAVDRIIELFEFKTTQSTTNKEPFSTASKDPFSNERRLEQRHPELAALLPCFVQGYDRTPESAKCILDYLCQEYTVNPTMASAIRQLFSL